MPDAEQLTPPRLVETDDALAAVVAELAGVERVAVDTESNSMHAFRERLCLLQLSYAGEDVVIDPLAVDIAPLGPLFADPAREKVFHAAEYDIIVMRRDHGFEFSGIFDTMWAARLLGWPRYGLGAILEERFGVRLDKKMQRHDWGRRPLSPDALEYARLDVHYLERLRETLIEELAARELFDEARAAFDRVATTPVPTARPEDADRFWRMKPLKEVPKERRGLLRALFDLRLEIAEELDRPVFKVAPDGVLAMLARKAPAERSALRDVRGLHPAVLRQHGERLLRTIAEHRDDPAPVPAPRPPRPPEELTDRFEALRTWRNERAKARGVEPDVILTKRVLSTVAEADPLDRTALEELAILDEWQLATYGDALLELLAGLRAG